VNGFKTRQEFKAKEMAESEGDLRLAVTVNTTISVQWRKTPSIIAATSEEEQVFNCE
jgi:hypothetical protein